jgi:ArsR family transcriptional regulator, arsenate/arsenite/antimonite-responsive transcriptional repressor / arsenate reductase (thioredoxin)
MAAQAERPPLVFQLAGHPLRWQLLRELSSSDRRVRELIGSLGEPQPLVSYHLRQLRVAKLVTARSSSFDARESYYSLDLERCRQLLADAGVALHPALSRTSRTATKRARSRPPRVLFLCTGNSARSQIAEALLHELSGGSVQAFSAGSRPKDVHPNTVRVLAARGIDIGGRSSKHLDTFRRRRLDYVISLCDRVREVCPEFPGRPHTIHWSIPDPAAQPGGDRDTYPAFESTAVELQTRIRFLLDRIDEQTNEKEVTRS